MGRTKKEFAYSAITTTIGTMTKRILILLLTLAFLSGCSQPLKTLMRVNSEQELHHKYVDAQDRKFALLLEHVEEDELEFGLSKSEVIRKYGDPVYEKQTEAQDIFTYRESAQYNPKEKVYLYFDQNGKLADFEYLVRDDEEVVEEPAEETETEPQEPAEESAEEVAVEPPEEEPLEASSYSAPDEAVLRPARDKLYPEGYRGGSVFTSKVPTEEPAAEVEEEPLPDDKVWDQILHRWYPKGYGGKPRLVPVEEQ
ncbi:hypothetical protein ACFL2J_04755 [Candidatus Omnitrophota bacterium]